MNITSMNSQVDYAGYDIKNAGTGDFLGGGTGADRNISLSTNSGMYGGSGTVYLNTAGVGGWSAGLDGSGNFSTGANASTHNITLHGHDGLIEGVELKITSMNAALDCDNQAFTNVNIDSGVMSIISANVALDIATVNATALPTEFQGVTGNVFVTIKDQNGKSIALTGFYIN
jgi:hypothetical protein